MSRWIRLQTSIFDHSAFAPEPFTEREAWTWMIMTAAWKDTSHRVGARVLIVPTGSFFGTARGMQSTWRWKSMHRVQNFLKVLENQGMISVTTGSGKTQVTICNYNKYQNAGVATGSSEGQNGVTTGSSRGHDGVTKDTSNTNNTISPIFERERERAKILDLEGFQKWFAAWPTNLTDDVITAEEEWSKISPEHRAAVVTETPKYIQGVMASGRKIWPAADKFLAKRMWERVAGKLPLPSKPLSPSQQRQADAIASIDAFKRGLDDEFSGTTIDVAVTPSPEDRRKAIEQARAEHIRKSMEHNDSWGNR